MKSSTEPVLLHLYVGYFLLNPAKGKVLISSHNALLSRPCFNSGNKVDEVCSAALFSPSWNVYLDEDDLVKQV